MHRDPDDHADDEFDFVEVSDQASGGSAAGEAAKAETALEEGEPIGPPDRPLTPDFGVTATEAAHGESLEAKLARESGGDDLDTLVDQTLAVPGEDQGPDQEPEEVAHLVSNRPTTPEEQAISIEEGDTA